jgi:hypothetical protein
MQLYWSVNILDINYATTSMLENDASLKKAKPEALIFTL